MGLAYRAYLYLLALDLHGMNYAGMQETARLSPREGATVTHFGFNGVRNAERNFPLQGYGSQNLVGPPLAFMGARRLRCDDENCEDSPAAHAAGRT